MTLFDEKGTLKTGKQKLMFYYDVEGDTNVVSYLNKTLGGNYGVYSQFDYKFQAEKKLEAIEIQKRCHTMNERESSSNQWLDQAVTDRLKWHCGYGDTSIPDTSGGGGGGGNEESKNWGSPMEELDLKACCFMIIEMPIFAHQVLHEEKQYSSVMPHAPPTSMEEQLRPYMIEVDNPAVLASNGSMEFSLTGKPFDASLLTIIADWDMDQENLCEDLHRRLVGEDR